MSSVSFGVLGGEPERFGPVLGLSEDRRYFTLDGEPTFLLGVSYYGALGLDRPDLLARDLDDMVASGFNWIRVWAFWDAFGEDVSALTPEGGPREPYLARLKALARECSKRRMVVDCTLRRDSRSERAPANLAQHLACARRIAQELLPYRNLYIDLANERDIGDARHVPLEEVGELIRAVKSLDPERLATASGVPGSAKELAAFAKVGRCDFLAPHLSREAGCAAKTQGRVREFGRWMREVGVPMPVHLQEPFRRGYGPYEPTAEDFLEDARGARAGGAAGWCLHNGSTRSAADGKPYRSFLVNSRVGRLYDQWDEVERAVLARLAREVGPLATRAKRSPSGGGAR
ncbi:MAG: hypothetical protein ACUVYA_13660 [Planctomycetota bacterium]